MGCSLYSRESIRRKNWIRQFLRYNLTGIVTFVFGMIQFKVLYHLIPETRFHSSVIWFLNFALGTLWIHALHRRFTFRDARHISYFTSLMRTYVSYAGIFLFGTAMMFLISDIGGMHHMVSWGVTNSAMSFFNFYFMRSFTIISWEGPS
jgi:hypothetical protein